MVPTEVLLSEGLSMQEVTLSRGIAFGLWPQRVTESVFHRRFYLRLDF